jgi:chaperonin GroES
VTSLETCKEDILMLKPLGDRVLLRPSEEEERTAGGIVLPDSARKRPQEGKVLAVGAGRTLKDGKRAPLSVKVGETVVYSKYAGTEIKVDGEELVILDEDSMLAVRE